MELLGDVGAHPRAREDPELVPSLLTATLGLVGLAGLATPGRTGRAGVGTNPLPGEPAPGRIRWWLRRHG